jgi:hypothetical protein
MLYNDSAWVKFVKNKTTVKDFKQAPSMIPNSNQMNIKSTLFDLSGRMVGNTGRNGALLKSAAIRMPAGVYFKSNGNGTAAKKVIPQ